jgi:tetratricopeptide (TPR) repeat protein
MILEKIPFLIVSVIFGIISLRLQALSAIGEFETFSLIQRAMHASYGFFAYIVKFLIPVNLSAFYPYPMITNTGFLPLAFRIAPFGILIMAVLIIFLWFRKQHLARVSVFGILFYTVTIALVLQFLSVGKAILADRYTYLPYIGLFFIAGMLLDYLLERRKSYRTAGIALAMVFLALSGMFMAQTWQRTKVWKNNITLWSDALERFPDIRMNFIYEKRARSLMEKEKFEEALADYNVMLRNDPRSMIALEAAGRIYGQYMNDLDQSLEILEKAYRVDSTYLPVLKNLGVAYGMKGQIRKSLDISLKVYAQDPKDPILLTNIANSYMYLGNQEKAEEFREKAAILEKENRDR